MEFVELFSWRDALTGDICDRARDGRACELTKKYSVRESGVEVGYVALNLWRLDECTDLVLSELFVPEGLRHRGIGARILAEIEELARIRGYARVLLNARPLDDYPHEQLVAWYQKHGFVRVPDSGADGMAKEVL